jgi:hypothetical protein
MRVLGKEKPETEPGAFATSKLKKLPGKTKPATLTLKRGKVEEPVPAPNPKPAKKSST